jgi:hypothetical protein
MVGNRANVGMIGEEDIKVLVDEWELVPTWIKAHVGARRPAHRYEGELLLEEGAISFTGRDIKEGRRLELTIPIGAVTDVRIGYSEYLMATTDVAFGTGGPVPLAVSYRSEEDEQTLYFTARADNCRAHVAVENAALYEALDSMIAGPGAGRATRDKYVAW